MSTIKNIKYVDANAFSFDSKHIKDNERNNHGEIFIENLNQVKEFSKETLEKSQRLNECQFCDLSEKNQVNFGKYQEKCFYCDKNLCEKCSILSSINLNKDIQKICLLCKKCSKMENLNLELSEINNKEFTNKNENFSNTTLNEEILTIDLKSSQISNGNNNNVRTLPPTELDTKNSLEEPKLKDVTDWLNKSFESLSLNSKKNSSRNYRFNSEEPIIQINDEPLVEISLNKDFYTLKKIQQEKEKAKSFSKNEKLTNDLQKICIYKDPKDIESNSRNSSRRPSSELGINISGCQSINDITEQGSLAALVTSVEPNGVMSKYQVEIEEGDEIVEINGFNLRNKNDEQIDEIFCTSCHSNNGEIELLVRRRSSISSLADFNTDVNSSNQKELRSASTINESVTYKNKSKSNLDIETHSTSSSCEIQVDLNEQSSITSSTFSSEIMENNSLKFNNQNNSFTMENSSSSQSLYSSHNHNHNQNETSENIFLKDNTPIKASAYIVDKKNLLPSKTKLTRLISDPKEMYNRKRNNSFKRFPNQSMSNQVENYKNESFDDENSLNERTSINSNLLNAENQSLKSNSLAKFRSSSPRDPLNSNSNNHSQSSLNEYDLNEDPNILINGQELVEVIKPRVKNDAAKSNLKINQAVESGSIPGLLGDIQVQINHDSNEQKLIVTILKGRNLKAKDANGFSDPFIKICLLPGREIENKRRSNCIFKNLNPVWNFTTFYPNIHAEEVIYKTLELVVWDWDRFSKNDFMGLVRIDLFDLKYLDNTPRWFQLQEKSLRLNQSKQKDN